jgi:hypothetical protein
MKTIHDFDSWLGESAEVTLTPQQKRWLTSCCYDWRFDPETGLVNVQGDFTCSGDKKGQGFRGVKFGEVSGDFRCSSTGLTSLDGAPRKVGRSFACSRNALTSLEGGPEEVGRDFLCSDNQLTDLKGSPDIIPGDFFCNGNLLKSLIGGPQRVYEKLIATENPIQSLEGMPITVGRWVQIGQGKDDIWPLIDTQGKKWNSETWFEIFTKGTPEARALIKTLPAFKKILDEHPEEYEDLSDLSDLGF